MHGRVGSRSQQAKKTLKKHAVTKHLLIDEHCQQLWEPTSYSGAVFSVACATTRRVFASQPLSGILVQTHQIHFLLLRLPSTEEKKRFTKLQRGDWQPALVAQAALSRLDSTTKTHNRISSGVTSSYSPKTHFTCTACEPECYYWNVFLSLPNQNQPAFKNVWMNVRRCTWSFYVVWW